MQHVKQSVPRRSRNTFGKLAGLVPHQVDQVSFGIAAAHLNHVALEVGIHWCSGRVKRRDVPPAQIARHCVVPAMLIPTPQRLGVCLLHAWCCRVNAQPAAVGGGQRDSGGVVGERHHERPVGDHVRVLALAPHFQLVRWRGDQPFQPVGQSAALIGGRFLQLVEHDYLVLKAIAPIAADLLDVVNGYVAHPDSMEER